MLNTFINCDLNVDNVCMCFNEHPMFTLSVVNSRRLQERDKALIIKIASNDKKYTSIVLVENYHYMRNQFTLNGRRLLWNRLLG